MVADLLLPQPLCVFACFVFVIVSYKYIDSLQMSIVTKDYENGSECLPARHSATRFSLRVNLCLCDIILYRHVGGCGVGGRDTCKPYGPHGSRLMYCTCVSLYSR